MIYAAAYDNSCFELLVDIKYIMSLLLLLLLPPPTITITMPECIIDKQAHKSNSAFIPVT